jgi:hypothetical protein
MMHLPSIGMSADGLACSVTISILAIGSRYITEPNKTHNYLILFYSCRLFADVRVTFGTKRYASHAIRDVLDIVDIEPASNFQEFV